MEKVFPHQTVHHKPMKDVLRKRKRYQTAEFQLVPKDSSHRAVDYSRFCTLSRSIQYTISYYVTNRDRVSNRYAPYMITANVTIVELTSRSLIGEQGLLSYTRDARCI